MANDMTPIEKLSINTIRTLAMDAVQAANSGHPGTPMGMAPTGYVLWQRLLRYDPENPLWLNRDRFVLSCGHASMLLYGLIHLSQIKAADQKTLKILSEPAVSLDEIKRFRQIGSKTPGHPESHLTTGVETTTGPLGQGLANSVGMAVSQRWLATRYNKPGFDIFDFDVYALCGDGCMMEGISHEAASFAAHNKLSNLCWIYDSNRITIEGSTSLAFSEDVGERFLGYGFNVIRVPDANDLDAIDQALQARKNTKDRPTLIIISSHIGYGAPHRQDTKEAHGEALGEEEVRLTKKFYGWPEDAKFLVPDGVYDNFKNNIGKRGAELRRAWDTKFEQYKAKYPELAQEIALMTRRELPEGWDKNLPVFAPDPKGKATRDSGAQVLNALAKNVPWLIGGAADLAPSTKTRLTFDGAGDFEAGSYNGRNFHYGVREHAMGAMINGMSLTKVRPYGSGFLIFSDYGRTPIRLAALMEIPVVYVFTHDSIGVGEDGPTHQPIEQLPGLRAIPNLILLRPGDAAEVVEAWKFTMKLQHEPCLLIFSRQAIPTLDRKKYASAEGLNHGAYVLADPPDGKPQVILIGTGTELSLCVDAFEKLQTMGVAARVVSMPSWEIFESYCRKNPGYRESVLPSSVKARVSVEMASTLGWERYIGPAGKAIGMHTFGASAPLKDLQKHFGFTVDAVVAAAKEVLGR